MSRHRRDELSITDLKGNRQVSLQVKYMLSSVWNEFLQSLTQEGSQNKFLYSILTALTPVELTEDALVVSCGNQGMKFFLQKKIPEIEQNLHSFFQKKVRLEVVVAPPKKSKEVPLFDTYKPTNEDLFAKVGLLSKYSFNNFAVAGSNQVAYAAALAVCDNLGHAYNPLFLYGGVGVGKTHLAQSVARKILEKDSAQRVFFCSGEHFTNELVEAIREKATGRFKRRYRQLNLLILDDVQFIAGKMSVQEEFFHTFNTIVSSGGQVIMTSDRSPHEIKNLEDRLRSRFSGGLIIDIQPPDYELRCAIVLIKAQERNIPIEMDAASLIAQEIADSRALEGTLLSASAYAKTKMPDEETLTKGIVEGFFSGKIQQNVKNITPGEVIKTVCSYYNIRPSHLKGADRSTRLSLPRQVAMFLLRRELGLKYEEIAYLLKKKDHTTIMHGVEKITAALAKDVIFKGEIDRIVSSMSV